MDTEVTVGHRKEARNLCTFHDFTILSGHQLPKYIIYIYKYHFSFQRSNYESVPTIESYAQACPLKTSFQLTQLHDAVIPLVEVAKISLKNLDHSYQSYTCTRVAAMVFCSTKQLQVTKNNAATMKMFQGQGHLCKQQTKKSSESKRFQCRGEAVVLLWSFYQQTLLLVGVVGLSLEIPKFQQTLLILYFCSSEEKQISRCFLGTIKDFIRIPVLAASHHLIDYM